MKNLRERIKSRLTVSQRKRLVRAMVRVKSTFAPGRIKSRDLPRLPNGRRWRSAIPYALHWSFQDGTLNYCYRDIPMLKHPVEIALYMRLIWEIKPATIIEIGTQSGGSAVWMADTLNIFNISGRVVSIDLEPPTPSYAPKNVTFLRGDANDLSLTLTEDMLSTLARPWLVIEDASHHYAATFAVLRFFDPLLRTGEYVVVEDANILEIGQDLDRDGGPARAIAEFLKARADSYEIDSRYCDQYGSNVTGNPNGYLRKIR